MTIIILDTAARGWARSRHNGSRHWKDAKTKAAQEQIAWAYRKAGGKMIAGPVSLTVEAVYVPPASWSKRKREAAIGQWKTTKPDTDNIVKLVKDALNGVAYRDDAVVADLGASKAYGEQDQLRITVERA